MQDESAPLISWVPIALAGIGGLGIYLMRQVVDEVRYQYIEGKNVLTLTKRTSA